MHEIADNTLFENFVTPALCRDLFHAGLTYRTNYKWVIKGLTVNLETGLFDVDGYYRSAMSWLHHVNSESLLPAYSIKDIEKCLPYWFMTHCENGYEISLDNLYGIESKKALRMPDAMAALLQETINKGVVSMERINYLIEQQPA